MFEDALIRLAVAPVLEELIFRAGLLQYLDSRFPRGKGWRWNLAVSLLFGLLHLWQWPAQQAALVVLPSLVLGWLWQRWHHLPLCMAAHSIFNGMGWAASRML